MKTEQKQAFGADRLLGWIQCWFQSHKHPFLPVVIIGMIAHGFAFANKFINHDEVGWLFGKGVTISSGRWGLPLTSALFPDYSMSWIYGILVLLMAAIAVCLVVDLFCIRSKSLQILLGGLVVTFPSLTGTFCYMFTSASYMLSFLLAVSAVCLMCSAQKYSRMILAVVCMVFSLGIYQAYIALAAGLLVTYLIWLILSDDGIEVKQLVVKGIGYVLFLAVSLIIYWVINKGVMLALDVEMNSYAQSATDTTTHGLIWKICATYYVFFGVFFAGDFGLVPTTWSICLHGICFAVIIVELLCGVKKIQQLGKKILLLVLFALLPMASNCMYLFISPASIHTLVLYGCVNVYVLVAVVLDRADTEQILAKFRKIGSCVAAGCMALVIVTNTLTANQVYLNLHMQYENVYSFANRALAQIEMLPGYEEEMPVMFAGDYENPQFYENFEGVRELMGAQNGLLNINSARWAFFEYYCGQTLNILPDAEAEQIQQTEEFLAMPSYPDNGSIRIIDGVVVVKLS